VKKPGKQTQNIAASVSNEDVASARKIRRKALKKGELVEVPLYPRLANNIYLEVDLVTIARTSAAVSS
jgi:hypothetical protein